MTAPLDIIFITHKLPFPPHKGYQVKPYQFIKGLTRRGHRVHLVCPDGEDSAVAFAELSKICASVKLVKISVWASRIRAGFALLNPWGESLSVAYFKSLALKSAIGHLILTKKIDAFALYSSTTAQYVPRNFQAKCLIDMGDIDSEKWRELAGKNTFPMSWVYRTEAKRLVAYEQTVIENFGATNLATEFEADLLVDLDPAIRSTKILCVPNGTDTNLFSPGKVESAEIDQLPVGEKRFFQMDDKILITFVGAMDYAPNVEAVVFFAEEVLPKILQRHPTVCFIIVGGNPVGAVTNLANGSNIFVTGFVRATTPYFRFAKVVVIPLRLARGIQNKALEGMACSAPIVSTSLVARGVHASDFEQMLVADTAIDFANAVMKLITDDELSAALGSRARQFVLNTYEWNPIIDQLAVRLESLVQNSGP